jgi:hypothetical protein
VRTAITDAKFKYHLTPSITSIVDPSDNSLQTISSLLAPKDADYPIYYLGPRTIFTKYYQIRGAIDSWLFDSFRTPARWELHVDRWYTLSFGLALGCLIAVPLALFCLTKALLVNSESVHID